MEIRKWLEQFPSPAELANLYERWTEKYPPLKGFSNPQQLIEYLYNRKPADFKRQDEILYSLISECRSSEEPSILTMYLFILLHSFLEMPFRYWIKRLWKYQIQHRIRNQIHEDELWNEIWKAFCETLKEFNLKKRNNKVGIYFQGKVKNYLEIYYRKTIKNWKSEIPYKEGMEEDERFLTPVKTKRQRTRNKLEVFSEEEILEMEPIFQKLIDEKVIDSTDKELLVENKLRGKSIRKIARERKESPAALLKRIWRLGNILIPVLKEIISEMSTS